MLEVESIQGRVGEEWISSDTLDEIRDPYRGELVARAPRSSLADLDRALDAAVKAKGLMAAMPGYERAALLRRVADRMEARTEEMAQAMTRESGKAIAETRGEVKRGATNLRMFAEEAIRIQGEHVPMDGSAIGAGKIGMVLRFPAGVVSAITPFNAPIHLSTYKIAPALAAGNAIVLKPSPKAPLAFHKMIECFVDADLPPGVVNVVYGDDVGPQMVSDPRVDFVTFTGSTRVGKVIRAAAGMKRVALELGGVGPTIVHHDADLTAAATACARNSMLLAGQSCVSVQNMHVHRSVAERFSELLVAEVEKLRFGDPMSEGTEVGTLIDEAAARRVESMVDQALEQGARALVGRGSRDGALLGPTILDRVDPSMRVVSEEIFGPAANLLTYEDADDVFASVTSSPYGLQCGIYTNSLDLALRAVKGIRTGGVIINGTSRWRSDQMPYGGVKDSGMGREGFKYSTLDMTEERFVVFN